MSVTCTKNNSDKATKPMMPKPLMPKPLTSVNEDTLLNRYAPMLFKWAKRYKSCCESGRISLEDVVSEGALAFLNACRTKGIRGYELDKATYWYCRNRVTVAMRTMVWRQCGYKTPSTKVIDVKRESTVPPTSPDSVNKSACDAEELLFAGLANVFSLDDLTRLDVISYLEPLNKHERGYLLDVMNGLSKDIAMKRNSLSISHRRSLTNKMQKAIRQSWDGVLAEPVFKSPSDRKEMPNNP